MVRITLRGVNRVRKRRPDGKWRSYYYHRATGTRLPDDPTSTEFIARLNELNEQVQRKAHVDAPGTFGTLITHYKKSAEYRSLAPKTQIDYGRYLDIIRANWGRNRVSRIDREAVLNLRDA